MAYAWSGGRTGFTTTQRQAILRRDPICRTCRRNPSVIADHIRNLAEGGTNTLTNGAGICKACSDRKTQTEAARGRARRGTRQRPTEPHPGLNPNGDHAA